MKRAMQANQESHVPRTITSLDLHSPAGRLRGCRHRAGRQTPWTLRDAVTSLYPECKKRVLMAKSHTRNTTTDLGVDEQTGRQQMSTPACHILSSLTWCSASQRETLKSFRKAIWLENCQDGVDTCIQL